MKIIQCDQLSPEWMRARCGIPTASGFDKILTTAGKPSTQAKKYMYQLAAEAVLGFPEESYQNGAMLRGIELEPEARKLYTLVTGNEVEQVGFCLTENSHVCGCSPDGLIGDDGQWEGKCPSMSVHVEYLMSEELPTAYFQQVQGGLYVTGRAWCDFMSYYPGLKPFIVRVERDEEFIRILDIEIQMFCEKLQRTIEQIRG